MPSNSPNQVIATIGMARYLHDDDAENILELDLGSFHPGAHGGLELQLQVADGVIESCRVRSGLMHRSAEKLFEARDYRQIMMLANRHDWVSAVSSELGVALAVEQATGIMPPDRATWSRMVLAEAGRIGASALFLAALDIPGALQLRERWASWQEAATGGRVHPMINRIGGLEAPIPSAQLDALSALAGQVQQDVDTWRRAIESLVDLQGLGVLADQAARDFACSGPVGQASGVDWDLRRDDPYLFYGHLDIDWSLPVHTAGDAASRYLALVDGMELSARIIDLCLEPLSALEDQPVSVPLPKTLRAPETTVHVWTQNPLGIAGWLLVSDGDVMPLRLKARTPSFAHLQAMESALVGTPVSVLAPAVASFFFVVGDADR